MVFKILKRASLLIIFLSILSCQDKGSSNNKLSNQIGNLNTKLDSIIFKTSNEEIVYLGERLYPNRQLSDSLTYAILTKDEIISVEKVGDTIFVFMDNHLLQNKENLNFPEVNNSMFKNVYPNHYRVEIDDDIPYIVYLENTKDYIQLIKSKKDGLFYWETAMIKDTILSFLDIKVGMQKEEVFSQLGLNQLNLGINNFSLILCHASIPYDIWYKKVLESKEFVSKNPNVQMLLNFSNNSLEYIYIDPWIGYGKKEKHLF
ncbi:MAG TPA: hypothetical protein P5509_06255 [Bacteroidales bacterium]|nr:hypothetical protein [Bacteroidales bacterium]